GLGKKVVVEGIETREQFAALVDLGCDYFQGFLFSAPLKAADFVRWSRDRQGDCRQKA
ncbi:MAG TPA: EAL domain-containing protein, partial [Methylothermaceae bacterium]|nr:EAL domain-containing protein [Methylothermaceae bacterium]